MSASQPLVSVVMTSYNYARFLDESIGSVVAQTYRALEIIIVDDRSSDSSWEIIQRWQAGDSRIRGVLTGARLGFVGALNMGVELARGEFVAIIDSDDVWLPQRIEKQVAVMTDPANIEVGVCGAYALLIDGEGKVTGAKEYPVSDEACRRALWYRNPFCHSAALIRKACFDRCGLYDPEFQMVQDLDLWFRIGQGFKFRNVPEYLAKYRISGHNASVQRQRRLISTTLAVRRAAVRKHGYRMDWGGRAAMAGAWCMKWLPTLWVHRLFHKVFLPCCSRLWEARDRNKARINIAPYARSDGPLLSRPRLETTGKVMPRVNITVPVYNEEASLPVSIPRLNQFLDKVSGFDCEIVIADNASTDRTYEVARALALQFPRVRVAHLELKGRGRALKQVWSGSTADILSYMDVDLSTDLRAFPPLIKALADGKFDLGTGSRLQQESKVIRGLKREFTSRCYNRLVKLFFSTKFSDAQCGFKAITREAAQRLLPAVEDTGWFFDTELLVLAEKSGHRIFDLPVPWIDDPDGRVKIIKTAWEDVKGLWRVRRGFRQGKYSHLKRSALASPVQHSSRIRSEMLESCGE